jgi:Flp pilus assembly protein TadG
MVEFALVVPILVLLVMGIVDVGRAYLVQTTVSNAAREGVRVMALSNDQGKARTAARFAATALTPALTDSQVTFSALSCTPGAQVTTIVRYPTTYITPLPRMLGVGNTLTLTGRGTMRCNG